MSEVFHQKDTSFLQIEKWHQLNKKLIAGFTTRNGGVSDPPFQSLNLGLHVPDNQEKIIKNRELLAKRLNIPLENWVSGEQVHGTTVRMINSDDKGKGTRDYFSSVQGVDGLITNEKNILCTAFFADCVPLFFYDPVTEIIGIAHAGWKGTVNEMAGSMVQAMKDQGVNESNLLVVIGPSISQEMYEVDEKVIDNIKDKYRQKCVKPSKNNRYLLDLKKLNVEILLQSGVLRHNIDVTNYCTFKDESLFFSHRRDKGKTGRMLGFLGIIS
ncbi:peptidoglycan editing factor PgeF [Oceanobacillus sp. Castelsardo]|uniref:peptidoglycan editing factor PgeF n=1 Tax=Oceanobacillus sp. Castelsardo TaxID=1851204 RepID=UPI000839507D|nr:peptidoglycan editing factor PgeF [Oceanobacillus sp. Castelsardo]